MFKVFKPLFFEKDILSNDFFLSLGRVAFWVIFGLSFYLWLNKGDIPDSLLQMNWTLLAYNLLKKEDTAISAIFNKGSRQVANHPVSDPTKILSEKKVEEVKK